MSDSTKVQIVDNTANPAPLGLVGFGLTTILLNFHNAGFFPLNSMSNLIKQPFSRLSAVQSVANQVGEKFDFDYAVHWYEIVIVLFWTAIFIFLSYRLLKMRDL